MTEAEWLSATDLFTMLAYCRRLISPRKFRLLVCACCRQNPWFMNLPGARKIIQVEERWADGLATIHDMEDAYPGLKVSTTSESSGAIRLGFLTDDPYQAAAYTIAWAIDDEPAAEQWCANQLRDIFGNPFRPVVFDSRWRTSDTVGLAQAIYDDKAFERVSILADALMDAGCEDEQVIDHCRGNGPHARGCWVVDLVLKKR